MPTANAGFARPGHITVREGNRKNAVSEWAQGRRFLPAFLVALVLVSFALFFVWTNYQSVQTGYSISDLHKDHDRLMALNRALKVELANLTALDRLGHLAKNELGLISPRADQVKVIK